jgi:hypothetical protein
MRRLLDAERVAKELDGVMANIHAANERFMVKYYLSSPGYVLMLRSDGDGYPNGGKNRNFGSRGRTTECQDLPTISLPIH